MTWIVCTLNIGIVLMISSPAGLCAGVGNGVVDCRLYLGMEGAIGAIGASRLDFVDVFFLTAIGRCFS